MLTPSAFVLVMVVTVGDVLIWKIWDLRSPLRPHPVSEELMADLAASAMWQSLQSRPLWAFCIVAVLTCLLPWQPVLTQLTLMAPLARADRSLSVMLKRLAILFVTLIDLLCGSWQVEHLSPE